MPITRKGTTFSGPLKTVNGFQRTLANPVVVSASNSVNTSQGSNNEKEIVVISAGTLSATKGYTLNADLGIEQIVVNKSTTPVFVFGGSGVSINGGAASGSVQVAAGASERFIRIGSTDVRTVNGSPELLQARAVQTVNATTANPSITKSVVNVSAVAAATVIGVTLAGRAGQVQFVSNKGANTLKVRIPTGGTINGGTTPYLVTANTGAAFFYITDKIVAAIG